MKEIKLFSALLLAFALFSCSTEDKTIDEVLGTTVRGAILRTIAVPNPTFDFTDVSSAWMVTVEEQDQEGGNLLDEVEVFAQLLSPNGNSAEALIKTVPATDFTSGPFGLPRTDISVALSEVLTALDLQDGEYLSSDQFNIRLNVKLTTGQSFTQGDTNPNIAGGQFFASPYFYRAQFFCPIDEVATLFTGTYIVVTDIWADYAPGNEIPVVLGESPYTFRILSTNNPFIGNPNTSYIEVTINPLDGTVTATSNEPFDYGGGFLLDVSGDGRVGACTGDITLSLDFGSFGADQTLTLTKSN